MCYASFTLFFGITVRALELCIVTRAYPRTKPALLAIDLIRARRESGRLNTTGTPHGETDVCALPGEVWQVVREHVVDECYADEVDRFVREYDFACTCEWCHKRSKRLRMARQKKPSYNPRRFSMADLLMCEYRMDCLIEDRDIRAVLADFRLCSPDLEPISAEELPPYDPFSSIAIVIPLVSKKRKDYPFPSCEIPHEAGPCHTLTRISPSIFALPPDARRRFDRLLATFPMLEPKSYVNDTICTPVEHVAWPDTTLSVREAVMKAVEEEEEEEKAAREPSWMLWGQATTCM